MTDIAVRNGDTRLEKIARNESLAALARLVQLIGIPCGLAFIGWLAVKASTMDAQFEHTNAKIDVVSEQVTGIKERVQRLEVWQDTVRRQR